MQLFIQIIINVFMLAAIYILVGLGFAFLFNMLSFFNVAHGSIYMISGYLGYYLIARAGLNQWIGLSIVILVMGCVGIFLERIAFRPFVGDFNSQVMVGVALIVILTSSINISVGTGTFVIPQLVEGAATVGKYSIAWDRILVIGIGGAVLAATVLFVKKTRWGRQMLALSQNMEGAVLQGIGVHGIAALASALGCALAALSGVVMGSMYALSPFMGDSILTKILMLVVIAGAGSIGGLFLTGLIMGALYAGLPMLLPGTASDAVAAIIVCLILLVRPQGFFGHEA